MARSQEAQRQRNQNNPLFLGSFETTSLRYLKGKLGPENQLVGKADTSQQSNGGFGGGTYNHWFQVDLKTAAWIIVAKGGLKPNYIQTSVYDLNKNPIEGRGIFQADSANIPYGTSVFYPYLNTAMGAQSDIYNSFSSYRLDLGDERYYPLKTGSYLICISTTRNEVIEYEVGLVIEFPITGMSIALEDEDGISLLLEETSIDFSRTINVVSPVLSDIIVSTSIEQPNGFTKDLCVVTPGVTVTVLFGSEWLIGGELSSQQTAEFAVIVDASPPFFETIHDHSLSEWRDSWEHTHQDTDKFPELFIPLTNRM